jgi:hypothetical protein
VSLRDTGKVLSGKKKMSGVFALLITPTGMAAVFPPKKRLKNASSK